MELIKNDKLDTPRPPNKTISEIFWLKIEISAKKRSKLLKFRGKIEENGL